MNSDRGAPKDSSEKQEENHPAEEVRLAFHERWKKLTKKYLWDVLAFSGNPPHIDARGVAIGLWVALGVPIGGHTLTLAILRFFIKFNVGLAWTVTWIINPLTIIPLYSAYYYVGSLVLGQPQAVSMDQFRELLQSIAYERHFWNSFKAFLMLDLEVLKRWAIAAVMVSVPSGTIGYLITYRFQSRRHSNPREHP